MSRYGMWKPYVPVAERRQRAKKKMAKLVKKGVDVQPVSIEGRTIARTFWGKAWCDHLESYSDYANRLPRGRTYVRNGSVCHLAIAKGSIEAVVSGSEIYKINIAIKTLPATKWRTLKQKCAGRIGSLLGLLKGDLSDDLMAVVTDRDHGLFPAPKEISLDCDCPDWADLCKHLAAVLYGVGARLDDRPELLFLLRGVDHEELIDTGAGAVLSDVAGADSSQLAAEDLSAIFGIDFAPDDAPAKPKRAVRKKTAPAKKRAKPKARAANKAKAKVAAKPKAARGKRTAAKKKAAPKKAGRPQRGHSGRTR